MRKKERAAEILRRLRDYYGPIECTLDTREDPWQLLVSAILAAQCTDARVNLVTPALFERFPQPEDFAASSPKEIEPYISSCGLYHNKAKAIFNASNTLLREFDGEVPQTREELLSIPGVGRKIANLLMGECFGQQAVVVDTHCGRISRLLGLTEEEDPLKMERDLVKAVPEDSWNDWGHYLVFHGRNLCPARRPRCSECFLQDVCRHGTKQRKLEEKRLRKETATHA